MAYAAISANSTAIFTNSNGCFSQTQKKPDNNHNISFLNASSSNFPRLSRTLSSSPQRYNPSRPIYINAASTVDLSSSVLAKEPGLDLKPNTGPKQTRPTILVSEKLVEAGLRVLREFAEVDCLYELSQEELCANISSYDALIVRSGTKVGRAVFEAAQGKLKVVGRAGVGIDNVDLQAATELGCLVVNAPTANTVAAAEHGIALLTSMARNVAQADASMKA